MGEISIAPKFNIHETYKKVRILNPYRHTTAPSGNTFLFQKYTGGKFSLSLRDNNGYGGNVLKVRNASNVELYFKYVDGLIDTAGILSHIGAGDGFLSEWSGYDESNAQVVFIQPSTANQPKIAEAGAIVLLNGKPAVKFDGVDDFLYHTGVYPSWTFMHDGTKNLTSIVASTNKTARGDIMGNIISGSDEGIMISLPISNTNKVRVVYGNGNTNIGINQTTTNAVISGNQNIIIHHSDNGNAIASERSYLKLNGTLSKNNNVTSTPTPGAPRRTMGIGSIYGEGSVVPFKGKVQEINIWQNDLLTELDNIEADINNYYL